MARTTASDERPASTRYAIEVAGHLDPRRLDDLGCIALRRDPAGMTVLVADVPDQAALHGVLARLRDLGIPLLALTRLPAPLPAAGNGARTNALPTPTPQGAPDA